MTDNSGFLDEERQAVNITAAFSEVEIISRSAANVFGRVNRYGKRWFFKGVNHESPDAAAARERLLKEFDIQIGLAHPCIERVIGIEEIEGVGLCVIGEWIEGETLADALAGRALSSAERLRILHEIIDAVSYLHLQGIVHRDLKPTNIMIRKNGLSAVVIDFGLADTDAHLYQKTPAGTEGYASPRQHVEHTPYTGDDIHALGVIMQQLCPGLASIASQCREGKYPTAEALGLAIKRRSRRRKITVWAGMALGILAIIASLLIYIASLRQSLSSVSQSLDDERAIRLSQEYRQGQIEELKSNLSQRLDSAYAEFRKVESPDDPYNLSLIRLIDLLMQTKADFFATEILIVLSDSESNELENSFILHYNDIYQQWLQIINQHSQTNLIE